MISEGGQWRPEPGMRIREGVLQPMGGRARRTDVSRMRWAIVGAVVLAVVAAGLVVARLHQAPARAATARRSAPETVVIDPQIGETFASAPPSAAPKLTAQQAWDKYAQIRYQPELDGFSPRGAIPARVSVRLGLLTLPVGPADAPGTSRLVKKNGKAYAALSKLVYGFSSPSGCVSMNPWVVFPPDARCIEWDFVNANTGNMIDGTWQKVGHWHVLIKPPPSTAP